MKMVRILIASGLALLLHVALATAVFDTIAMSPSTAEGRGDAGMEIGLGVAGSYTDAIAQASADIVADEATAPPAKTGEAPEEPVAPPPAPAPPPAVTVPQPENVKAVQQQDNSAATLAAADPEPVREPRQEPAPQPQSTKPAAAAQRATGTGSDRSAGGKAGDQRSYFAELMAWLNKHKSYPREAKKAKQQGVVELQFTLQRDGTVLASSIRKGSDYPLLDEAALAMLAAASPLPALPASMDRQQITLVIPIEFSLITNNRYKE